MAASRPLAAALLGLALYAPASGHEASVADLVHRLDLVAYSRATAPPAFTGESLGVRRLSLAELRGSVVVVNFWATWCAECRPEMPVLDRLYRELAPRGFAVVGVNSREHSSVVERYARELGLTFPIVLDPTGETSARYGVVGLPTTFVVARDGRAVAFGVGPREWSGAAGRALLEKLLAEPRPVR